MCSSSGVPGALGSGLLQGASAWATEAFAASDCNSATLRMSQGGQLIFNAAELQPKGQPRVTRADV